MSVTYEVINIPDPESSEEKLERLLSEYTELEMKYYNYSNRTDKEDDILTSIENELTAKKTEYTDAGGSFDWNILWEANNL
mgnify:CR=1 FL=1